VLNPSARARARARATEDTACVELIGAAERAETAEPEALEAWADDEAGRRLHVAPRGNGTDAEKRAWWASLPRAVVRSGLCASAEQLSRTGPDPSIRPALGGASSSRQAPAPTAASQGDACAVPASRHRRVSTPKVTVTSAPSHAARALLDATTSFGIVRRLWINEDESWWVAFKFLNGQPTQKRQSRNPMDLSSTAAEVVSNCFLYNPPGTSGKLHLSFRTFSHLITP
jgi:hypothetical protein